MAKRATDAEFTGWQAYHFRVYPNLDTSEDCMPVIDSGSDTDNRYHLLTLSVQDTEFSRQIIYLKLTAPRPEATFWILSVQLVE